MQVKPHHPLQELIGQCLFSIETVPATEQRAMVNRACKEAVAWHEAKLKAERKRAADQLDTLLVDHYTACVKGDGDACTCSECLVAAIRKGDG